MAAMCHELSQGNASALKLCTKTFFDLLLPTVEIQGTQTKRKAGGEKQQVHRQFVSRQQLATLVYLVKVRTLPSGSVRQSYLGSFRTKSTRYVMDN